MLEILSEEGAVSARLTGDCSAVDLRRLIDSGASRLFVNSRSINDLSFLTHLPLRELDLVAVAQGTAVTPVNFLTSLVRLNLAFYYDGEFKADGLTELEDLFIEWGAGAESITACRSLRHLYINSFPGQALDVVASLPHVEVLRVGNAKKLRRIDELATFSRLRALGIYYCPKLLSVAPVPTSRLVRVDAEACKAVADWGHLSEAPALNYVALQNVGEVASIQPFARCAGLEFFWFPESTNVLDGKIRWLGEVPTLRATGFQDRRHYDVKRDELKQMIATRHGTDRWVPADWDSI